MKSGIFQTLAIIAFIPQCSLVRDYYFWPESYNASDWGAYQARVCGRECQNNTLVKKRDYCSDPLCFPCDCDDNCSLFGTCCQKYDTESNTYYNDIETSLDKNPLQWYKRLHCWKPTFLFPKHYLTVVSCPPSWGDQEMRDKCEHSVGDSMDSVTPFSDRTTRLVFLNAHCAKCHGRQLQTPNKLDKLMDDGEDKLIAYPWTLGVQCFEYQDLYNITDVFEFYKGALGFGNCMAKFELPVLNSLGPKECRSPFDMSLPDGECSWMDPALKSLCHSLDPIPSLTVFGHRNLFCSFCNFNIPTNSSCPRQFSSREPQGILPPMYLLFNPNQPFSDVDIDVEQCPSGHWRNDEGMCILAACTPGKKLNKENETCRTAISDIKGLGYNLDLIFVALSHIEKKAFMFLDQYVRNYIGKLGAKWELKTDYFTKYCPTMNKPTKYSKMLIIHVTGFVIAYDNISRDATEEKFITSILQSPLRFSLAYNNQFKNIALQAVSIGHDMVEAYRSNESNERYFPASFYLSESKSVCLKEQHIFPILATLQGYKRDYSFYVKSKRDRFVDINPTLACPFITFNITDHYKLENGSLVFTVYIRDQNKTLILDSRVSFVDGKLLLCLNLVKELTAGDGARSENTLLVIQIYTDIVCTSVSVACLVVSFITYCLLPSLRSLPGLNNMCLCASLATAQMSLLITAIYGVRGRLNEIHCLIHAVVLHYSWLASFCWMNTCSIHMYRVFTSTRAINTWSVRKTHCRYCLYSFGIPLVLVFSTIIITSTTTGGDSIGYNDTICFLDVFTSTLTTILALLVPAALTIVINIILFGLTVREIVNVTRLQQSTRGSQGVMTYIKLSTVTGAFCAVAAAAVLSQNQVLMIVASPLGALMGFFIFMAFIFNKHVGKLYADLFLRRPSGRTSRTSNQSTINRTSSTKVSVQASDA